jgi:transcription initiation factor TFIIB
MIGEKTIVICYAEKLIPSTHPHSLYHIMIVEQPDLTIPNELFDQMYELTYKNESNILPTKLQKTRYELESCPDCKDSNLVEDVVNGIIVCDCCGLKLYTMLDPQLEMQNYDGNDGKKASTSGYITINPLLPNCSMSSSIKGANIGSLSTYHKRGFQSYEEKRMSNFFKLFQQQCADNHFAKIIEDDMKILMNNFVKVEDGECQNLKYRAKNLLGILQGVTYISTKKNNVPYTLREIAEMWNSEPSVVSKGIKNFMRIAKEKGMTDIEQIATPSQFIKRFCNKLGIKEQYTKNSLTVAINLDKLQICDGQSVSATAVACIFMIIHINNLGMTRKQLSDYFGVSSVTINSIYKTIAPFSKILLNDEICNKLQTLVTNHKNTITYSDTIIPNFVRFSAIPPTKDIFNPLVMDNNGNIISIKTKLMDAIMDENDKALKRQTYIMNKTIAKNNEFLVRLDAKIKRDAEKQKENDAKCKTNCVKIDAECEKKITDALTILRRGLFTANNC